MVGLGAAMAVTAAWALIAMWRRRLDSSRALLRVLAIVTPFGFIATEAGWTVTEVGRQPWAVAGLIRTAAAVTPMPGLVYPMVLFTALYIALAVVVVLVMRTIVRQAK
jgi:cytochrome d ubiquinol oxidase subunit I